MPATFRGGKKNVGDKRKSRSTGLRLEKTWGKGRVELEQLAAQHASQAEDARTEQHDAAGLRNRAGRGGAGAGRGAGIVGSQNRERFRRNRSDGALRSRRRTRVLVPVNWVAARYAGVLQVQP